MWDYYAAFEDEALKRGIEIDLNSHQLTGNISNISEDGVVGTCQFHFNNPNEITIDRNFWNNASELIKEMVVFHELGHCVLFRGHLEDFDNQGTCLSVMNSGLAECRVRYNVNNREAYLNELFLAE